MVIIVFSVFRDDTQTAVNVVKCKFCKESVSDTVIYAGPLANSRDERDVLFSKELNLCEETIDDKPQNKLTKFRYGYDFFLRDICWTLIL